MSSDRDGDGGGEGVSEKPTQEQINDEVTATLREMAEAMQKLSDSTVLLSTRINLLESALKKQGLKVTP